MSIEPWPKEPTNFLVPSKRQRIVRLRDRCRLEQTIVRTSNRDEPFHVFQSKTKSNVVESVDVIFNGVFTRSSPPPGSTLPLLGGLAMMAEKPVAVMSFTRIAAGPWPLVGATTTTGTRLKGCVKATLIHLAVRTMKFWISKVGSTSVYSLRWKKYLITVILRMESIEPAISCGRKIKATMKHKIHRPQSRTMKVSGPACS